MSCATLRLPPLARPRATAHASAARARPASAQPQRGACAARASRSFVIHAEAPAGDLAVHVYATPEAQAAALCALVERCAAEAIAARGAFALAVPGGSVLKMLAGLSGTRSVDWSKVVLCYANHKAVDIADEKLSTHAKAKALFLNACPGITVLAPTGGTDPVAEAKAYEAGMLALSGRLPFGANGVPCFDLMLLGVGADGHVGSLYPGRPEALDTGRALVLPVQKGSGPGSITLSLACMSSARKVAMAMSGASKADAVKTCLQQQQSPGAFPAQMVRCPAGEIVWLLDAGAASKLDAADGVKALL